MCNTTFNFSRTHRNKEQILNPKALQIIAIQVLQEPRFASDNISFTKFVQRISMIVSGLVQEHGGLI